MAPALDSWPQPASTPGEPSPCQGVPKHCLGGNDSGLDPGLLPGLRHQPSGIPLSPSHPSRPSRAWGGRGGGEGVSLGLNAHSSRRRSSCSTVCSECTCRSGSSGYGDTIYYTSDRDSHSLSDNEEPSDVDDDTDDDDEAGPGWLDGGPGQGLSLAPGTAPGRGGGNPTDSPGPSNTQGCHAPYKALCAGLTRPLAPASGTCPTYMWVQECQRLAVAAAASLSCMETGSNSLPPPQPRLG